MRNVTVNFIANLIMKSITINQMKKIDLLAVKRYGIPALILMENAGRSASEEALRMLPKKGSKRAAVFCGYGNNGGDGFVCARHLINRGIRVQIYLVGRNKEFSEEAKINYKILRKMDQEFKLIKGTSALSAIKKEIKKYRLVIDGIFGIGLNKQPDIFYQKLFIILNISKVPILALDVPSGLDADTGKPLGSAIQAVKTVTFGLLKKGLMKTEAAKFTGKIIIGDISLPRII